MRKTIIMSYRKVQFSTVRNAVTADLAERDTDYILITLSIPALQSKTAPWIYILHLYKDKEKKQKESFYIC